MEPKLRSNKQENGADYGARLYFSEAFAISSWKSNESARRMYGQRGGEEGVKPNFWYDYCWKFVRVCTWDEHKTNRLWNDASRALWSCPPSPRTMLSGDKGRRLREGSSGFSVIWAAYLSLTSAAFANSQTRAPKSHIVERYGIGIQLLG